MIKMIAIDLDGTLLNRHKKIPAENIKAIQKAAQEGIKIVLCTGRPQSGVEPYFKNLDLGHQAEYAVLNNGCSTHQIEKGKWELLSYHELSLDDIQGLERLIAQNHQIELTLTEANHFLVMGQSVSDLVAYDASLVFTKAKPISFQGLKALKTPIFQAMYMGEEANLDQFERSVDDRLSSQFSTVRSQSYLYEVMPKGITKASGLKALAEHLLINPRDIMAIGDAPNDLEMLSFAGLSVAMGNASESIRQAADKVSLTNDEAGVAYAIETWALGSNDV